MLAVIFILVTEIKILLANAITALYELSTSTVSGYALFRGYSVNVSDYALFRGYSANVSGYALLRGYLILMLG